MIIKISSVLGDPKTPTVYRRLVRCFFLPLAFTFLLHSATSNHQSLLLLSVAAFPLIKNKNLPPAGQAERARGQTLAGFTGEQHRGGFIRGGSRVIISPRDCSGEGFGRGISGTELSGCSTDEILAKGCSRFLLPQFLTRSSQVSLIRYSASHPVFALQENHISVNDHSEDINLSSFLILEPVPYF